MRLALHRLARPPVLPAVGAALTLGLASCGGADGNYPGDATVDGNVRAAWVEIGAGGNDVIVRAITADSACPKIALDNTVATMTLRAAASTVAQRTVVSAAADAKPSAFPVTTCETTVPAGTTQVIVGGRAMPLPKAQPQRIVVLADTGCRLQKSSNAYQACTDAAAWPFATIAATAAAMKPDLVLHIGDYHYRENACPTDIAGCQASPWGYGWDAWQADLFQPAAPLMAAAPWVVVRGNHEECARAGQGWYRFLDVHALDAAHTCDNPANDDTANFAEPYAVALGSDTQLIVFDTAKSGATALAATSVPFVRYQAQLRTVATLAARPNVTTIFANHHPILGFTPVSGGAPAAGSLAMLSVMKTLQPTAYYPPGVQLALHGHVHDFQALSFSSAHPAAFVTGNGGDNVDVNLPDPLPAGATPADGAVIDRITHTNTFGFMVMDRDASVAPARWIYRAYTRDGKLMTTCTPSGSKMSCDKLGFLAP